MVKGGATYVAFVRVKENNKMSIIRELGEITIFNSTSGFSNELMKRILKFDKVYSIHFFEDEFRPINTWFEEHITVPSVMSFDVKIEKYMGANVYFDIDSSLREREDIRNLIKSINGLGYIIEDNKRDNFGIIKGGKGH